MQKTGFLDQGFAQKILQFGIKNGELPPNLRFGGSHSRSVILIFCTFIFFSHLNIEKKCILWERGLYMSSTALNGLLEYLYGTLSADNMCWVATHLMERADKIKGAELRPYTMEEINDRLDKAEQDFDAGLGRTSEEVFKRLDEKFQTELRASTV